MSRVNLLRGGGLHGFPRVSGDEPTVPVVLLTSRAFSPRERG